MRPLGPSERTAVGPYRLLAELGRGGMGQVCLGAGPDGRLVAVKLIHDQLAADPGFRERFRREVDASRRVSGAHTAAVIDADPDAATPWLASVFVPGPALRDAVAAAGPMSEDSVLRLAAGLASALITIHGAGLVHRDLNPGNVLLTDDGVRVIDFGIAHAADSTAVAGLTRAGSVVGAPGYMSPERARGLPTGPASDMFSVGCVLALACTGVDLFDGDAAPRVLERIVHTEPDLSAVPPRVRRLVAPCLAKDPARRPTAAQLRELAGAIVPAAQPWPAGVHGLIARQRADLARLLDTGTVAGTTTVVPAVGEPGGAAVVGAGAGGAGAGTSGVGSGGTGAGGGFPRGVAAVGPAPGTEEPGERQPAARRSRLRLVFWLCAAGTAVVLLATLGIGIGWTLATTDRGAAASGQHRRTASPTPSPTSPSPSTAPTTPAPVAGPVHGLGGLCLDVHDAATDNGTAVQVYHCNGTDAQNWLFGADGTLRSLGKCLDATGGATDNGTKVQLYDCNGTPAQQWTARDGQLVNTKSGRCLDATDSSTEDGTQAQIWDCTGGENQQWQLPS
ncbi:serine/threonine-protein kinase [Actinocatenispora rupis]|uniref:Protein kinase domain-containing protein n=1 Tax=Actinocatenispora rupis TaxID=519421 RepID=A0A8J3NBJ7_9ACTN|nr:serine/threonine-protein kinase [Actinocatenispora rupis]GID10865.1 hypothetical protein Aru02nite_17540 [Actinocatenispora rupis]